MQCTFIINLIFIYKLTAVHESFYGCITSCGNFLLVDVATAFFSV